MASMERIGLALRSRRWLAVSGAALAVVLIATVLAWPVVVRQIAIARIQVMTHRQVSIDAVSLNPFTGRIAIQGLRLLERDGNAPFTDFERLDVRVRLLSLLRGHLWIRDAVLQGSTVRVIRFAEGFNFSDLIQSSGPGGQMLDVTVDRFVVSKGTVMLEDRALSEPRTWRSENIEIEARNLSTRRDDGSAVASSITGGAPVSLEMRNIRLYPIHFGAVVTAKGIDLGLARLYFPPDAALTPARGRASSTLKVTLDARAGVRADATGEIENLVLMMRGQREPAAIAPKVKLELRDLLYRDDKLAVGRLEMAGAASVRDPTPGHGGRLQVSTLRASIADVTWPVTTPGRLDVESTVPGGGKLTLTGQLRPPPAASQLRLRLATVDLAPWTALLPVTARIDGIAEADLRVDEPLTPGVPSRVQGFVAVNQIGIRDSGRELLGARRVEASGLEMHWPSRVAVKQVIVTGPRATIERDKAGGFPLLATLKPGSSRSVGVPAFTARTPATPTASSIALRVGEIVVKDGAVTWRDEAVTPRVALDFTALEAKVTGGGWPLGSALGVRASVAPPRGGQVQVAGRVGVDPVSADVRVTGTNTELAPYQAYLPVPATVGGRVDLDLAVVLPPLSEGRAIARGSAAMSRVDVRDGERTVMRVERATATGVDIDWPRRVVVRQLGLQQPWVLLERDRAGALPLRELLSPRAAGASAAKPPSGEVSASNASSSGGSAIVPVTLEQVVIDDGGARVVDHRIAPPFALDLSRLVAKIEGLSTAPRSKPAQLELKGRAGATSILAMRGTVGSFGRPLHLDLNGELQGFAVPRTNPYLVERVAWEARNGWLSTTFRCRIDGDALDARTEIKLNRLEVARAGARDEAQARIGLPLGMIVALMKDSRGDIHVTLPVSGRLSDPRFDLSDAIWSTVRNVAIKAITAPVSWIGRVQLDGDSRIQRIDVDPIPFAPGRAALTPEAREQVTRVAAFLEQAPEMRMALTPIVSFRDRAALGQKTLDTEISRVVRDEGLTPAAAAERLFKERFPGEPAPPTAEAMRLALAGNGAVAPSELSDLAARRLEAVREGIKKAGIDAKRLREVTAANGADSAEGQVKLDLVEPEDPGPPTRPNFFRRLLGKAKPGVSAGQN
jgi:hypothetical protein